MDTPNLVSQFNLFLDKHGIIRSKGQIDKNIDLKYHVVNPILMPAPLFDQISNLFFALPDNAYGSPGYT